MACGNQLQLTTSLVRLTIEVQNKLAGIQCTLRRNHKCPHFDSAFNLEWIERVEGAKIPEGWKSLALEEEEYINAWSAMFYVALYIENLPPLNISGRRSLK